MGRRAARSPMGLSHSQKEINLRDTIFPGLWDISNHSPTHHSPFHELLRSTKAIVRVATYQQQLTSYHSKKTIVQAAAGILQQDYCSSCSLPARLQVGDKPPLHPLKATCSSKHKLNGDFFKRYVPDIRTQVTSPIYIADKLLLEAQTQ
ncbi:unnamed protein product [Prunus armeniaca]